MKNEIFSEFIFLNFSLIHEGFPKTFKIYKKYVFKLTFKHIFNDSVISAKQILHDM